MLRPSVLFAHNNILNPLHIARSAQWSEKKLFHKIVHLLLAATFWMNIRCDRMRDVEWNCSMNERNRAYSTLRLPHIRGKIEDETKMSLWTMCGKCMRCKGCTVHCWIDIGCTLHSERKAYPVRYNGRRQSNVFISTKVNGNNAFIHRANIGSARQTVVSCVQQPMANQSIIFQFSFSFVRIFWMTLSVLLSPDDRKCEDSACPNLFSVLYSFHSAQSDLWANLAFVSPVGMRRTAAWYEILRFSLGDEKWKSVSLSLWRCSRGSDGNIFFPLHRITANQNRCQKNHSRSN